jgi:hypothetical protein
MSAFSLFFTWSESFLAYQRRRESGRNGANCKSLFGIEMFPSDDPFLLCWKWCRPNSSSRALIRHLEQRCQPGAWRTLSGRAAGYRRHHAHIFTGSDVRIQEGRQIRYSRFERGLSQATPGVLFDLSGVDLSRIENVREVRHLQNSLERRKSRTSGKILRRGSGIFPYGNGVWLLQDG